MTSRLNAPSCANDSLSDDVLLHLFGFLGIRCSTDCTTPSLVCKSWYRVCKKWKVNHQILSRSLFYKDTTWIPLFVYFIRELPFHYKNSFTTSFTRDHPQLNCVLGEFRQYEDDALDTNGMLKDLGIDQCLPRNIGSTPVAVQSLTTESFEIFKVHKIFGRMDFYGEQITHSTLITRCFSDTTPQVRHLGTEIIERANHPKYIMDEGRFFVIENQWIVTGTSLAIYDLFTLELICVLGARMHQLGL